VAARHSYAATLAPAETADAWRLAESIRWAVAGVLWCVLAWVVIRGNRRGR